MSKPKSPKLPAPRPPAPKPAKRKPTAKPPAKYTPALGARICALIADGATLRQIARTPGLPAKSTILAWAASNEAFRTPYAEAMKLRTEGLADEILDISDDGTNDWRDREVKDGWIVHELDPEAINRSRLRVDARKWLLAKLDPKKYGDKVDVGLSTPNGPLVFRWLGADEGGASE